jgi:hypothetical protein
MGAVSRLAVVHTLHSPGSTSREIFLSWQRQSERPAVQARRPRTRTLESVFTVGVASRRSSQGHRHGDRPNRIVASHRHRTQTMCLAKLRKYDEIN